MVRTTYSINDVTLEEVLVSNRRTANKWNIEQQAAENVPHIEQTGQGPTGFNINLNFVDNSTVDRHDMCTSVKAEIHECKKILIQSTDKYLYGDQKYVWLAQSNFNITESGKKQITVNLTGQLDPYQIHTCDFLTDWTGTSLTSDTAHDRKYAVKDTVASPVATSTYNATYNPSWTHDLSSHSFLTYWTWSDRTSASYTNSRFILQTSANNYYYWDTTYGADTWAFIECDLSSPDGTVGSPSLSNIGQIKLRIVAADTTAFFHRIDDIRVA